MRVVERRPLLAFSFVTAAAAIYACVGDSSSDDTSSTDGGANEGSSSFETGAGDDTGGGDAGGDANGGACDGGTICSTQCTDTRFDTRNCGRCGHDCGTGSCSNSVCQPVLIAGDADGGAIITSIATDQTDDNPKGLATHVFWSVTGTGGGIFQANVTGSAPIQLSTSAGVARTNVVVNQTDVYWFGQNFGGPPQPILKSKVDTSMSQASVGTMNGAFIQSILFDPVAHNVLGSYAANGTNHGVFSCGPDGGVTCTSLITFSGQPGGNVATDGTHVYFCDPGDGLVLEVTLNGGSAGTYVQSQDTPNLLRVDGNNVYWSNSATKKLLRGPTGSVTTPKPLTTTANAAEGLAADAVNVYWTESATGTVNFAPVAGTGSGPNTPYVILGPSTQPMHLVRDTGFLYFTHKGGIYRVALP